MSSDITAHRSLAELGRLDGRVALITGGAGHIGSALADALAELGASVAVVDVAADRANSVAAQLHGRWGVPAEAHLADLGDVDAVRDLPDRVVRSLGRLDIVVNNAALVGTSELKGWAVPFEQQDVRAWQRALDINLTAAFVLTQAAVTHLRVGGHGSIINVGSIYAVCGPDWRMYAGTELGNPAAYGATKGGLLQLTRWLATTVAPAIRVNMLSPGGVFREQPAAFVKEYVDRTPLRRMASEEDLKGAVAFLASDLSAYVTGQHLIVDGGWTAW
jgi:NAD(P)-dependent dehydrogenase (short-subunit alcohol dehydrogenase family)